VLPFLILQRKIKYISNSEFKRKVTLHCRRKENYNVFLKSFSDYILQNVNKDVILKLKLFSDEDTINVLVSASIEDYVSLIAKRLGWEFIATIINDDGINHNYGKQKLVNILNQYSKDEYIFNYAISDSESDLELLYLFNKYDLIK
jgi:phosphoserine phosphatase